MTGLVIRQIRDDDIESVHDLAERFFQFAHQRSTYLTPEALRYLVSSPGVDASTDTLLVERNGRPVAAAVVTANPPYSETGAALVVDPALDAPDMRQVMELITAGFSAALAPRIASPGAASDPWQHFMMPRSVPVAGSVLGDLGFEPLRQVYEMVIDLAATAHDEPVWPAGVRWRVPTTSDADLTDAANVFLEAFQDHHGDVFTAEQLASEMTRAEARLDVGVLAFDDAGPVGLLTAEVETEGGYVSAVAVVRRARGRGIGSALLRQSFVAMRDAEIAVCRLHVESENLTGAVRLYERAGMTRESVADLWLRRVPSSAPNAPGA